MSLPASIAPLETPPCPRQTLFEISQRFEARVGARVRLIWAPTDTVLQARCQRILRRIWWQLGGQPGRPPRSADVRPAMLNGSWSSLVWADRFAADGSVRYRFIGTGQAEGSRRLLSDAPAAGEANDGHFVALQGALLHALRGERELLQVILRDVEGGEWSALLAPFADASGTVGSVLSANVVSGPQGRTLQQRYRTAMKAQLDQISLRPAEMPAG